MNCFSYVRLKFFYFIFEFFPYIFIQRFNENEFKAEMDKKWAYLTYAAQ